MKPGRLRIAGAAALAVMVFVGGARLSLAQEPTRVRSLTLYIDPATGQIFTRPARGRQKLIVGGETADPAMIENQVEWRRRPP